MSMFRDFFNNKIDKQTLFNHVYTQIIMQGKPALSLKWPVLLDHETGCKCAIGHLLDDHDLSTIQSKNPAYVVGVNGVCMYLGLPIGFVVNGSWDEKHEFLFNLQQAHDHYVELENSFIGAFTTAMKQIAYKNSLIIPVQR